jgi:hypothetical protein
MPRGQRRTDDVERRSAFSDVVGEVVVVSEAAATHQLQDCGAVSFVYSGDVYPFRHAARSGGEPLGEHVALHQRSVADVKGVPERAVKLRSLDLIEAAECFGIKRGLRDRHEVVAGDDAHLR